MRSISDVLKMNRLGHHPYHPKDTTHMFQSISDIITLQSQIRGRDTYLTIFDRAGEADSITFEGLDIRTRCLATWLSIHHGIRPGSCVAIPALNDLPSVLAVFAASRLGAVILLLSPVDPKERQAELIRRAGAETTLRSPNVDPLSFDQSIEIPDTRHLGDRSMKMPLIAPMSDAFLIGTSGSTAASKLVRQTHGNAVANATDTACHHSLAPGHRLLGCLPIHHVNGLHFSLITSLLSGCHLVMTAGYDALSYPRIMAATKPRVASVVPSILMSLAEVWRGRELPPGFEYFVSAAAPLSSDIVAKVDEAIGARIVQGYGLSETTNFSCTMPPGIDRRSYEALMMESAIPPVGQAISNDIAIFDKEGQICPDGTVGELVMRGPNVMAGYFENKEATQEAFRDGWFHSGDLGFAAKDANTGKSIFTLTGRIKNIAKVRGETVSLDEMDRNLAGLPGILDSVCLATQDPQIGEQVIVVVVAEDVTDEDIDSFLRRKLSPRVFPVKIVRMDRIPRTPTGKILRQKLKDSLSEGTFH